jgi:hypothetical protein
VLFAQDFSRRCLGIIARLYRFNAQLACTVVKDAKQIACDRIAGFDDLARIKLIWIGPPYRATHAMARRLRARRWRGLRERRRWLRFDRLRLREDFVAVEFSRLRRG